MLVNIQFLRFAAAMLVVVYHSSFQLPSGGDNLHGLFRLGEETGFAGVDIFFVISGFIMAYTTLDNTGGTDSLNFARRRLARIFSGYWPFFFLALAVFYWTRPQHLDEAGLIASFLLWPQPLNRILLEITWTLSFELYFYLLFALVVLLVPRDRRMITCLLIVVGIAIANLYRYFVVGSFRPEQLYAMPFAVHFLIAPFLLEFFAGALIAYWLAQRPDGWAMPWLLGGSALYLLAGWVNEYFFAGQIEQGFYVVPRVLWFGTAAVSIVIGLVRLEHKGRRFPSSFSIRTGGASYAIYLSHVPLLALAQKLGMPGLLADQPFGQVAGAYCLLMMFILAFSVFHYEKFERPLHRLFKRWLGIRDRERTECSIAKG